MVKSTATKKKVVESHQGQIDGEAEKAEWSQQQKAQTLDGNNQALLHSVNKT